MKKIFRVKSEVWLYAAEKAAWHFASVPKKESKIIKDTFGKNAKGWGSIPVKVTIGKTAWRTSVFPDKKSETYILPIKAVVRMKESIQKGKTVTMTLEVML